MSVPVLLTGWEFKRAVDVANARMAQANHNKFNHACTYERDWLERLEHEVLGACAECAVCKFKNCNWAPLEELDRWHEVADIGTNIEVRATKHDDGGLLIYEGENLNRWYVLVTGHPPRLMIRGYLRGTDVIRDEWRYPKPKNRNSWLAPQAALIPVNARRESSLAREA